MNAVDIARTLVEHAADALLVSSLGTAISALRRTSNDGPHFYFGGAMGSTVAPNRRRDTVRRSGAELARSRRGSRPVDRGGSPRACRHFLVPGCSKAVSQTGLCGLLSLRRPSSREGALRHTRERR